MRTLGEFLGVGYDPGMVNPYADEKKRMTDGVHAMSVQVGDANFHRHGALRSGKSQCCDRGHAAYRSLFAFRRRLHRHRGRGGSGT